MSHSALQSKATQCPQGIQASYFEVETFSVLKLRTQFPTGNHPLFTPSWALLLKFQ